MGEDSFLSEGLLEHPEIDRSGNLDGTEAREVGGDPLRVEELEALPAEDVDEGAQSDL